MTDPTNTYGHGSRPPIRPGVVAGAVLRAARTSARATETCLAAAVGVGEDELRAWEDGAHSLSEVPFSQLELLTVALTSAGAEPAIVADLVAATWCDLVVVTLAEARDVSCLLADPVAASGAFHELLTWRLGGDAPARYRPHLSTLAAGGGTGLASPAGTQ